MLVLHTCVCVPTYIPRHIVYSDVSALQYHLRFNVERAGDQRVARRHNYNYLPNRQLKLLCPVLGHFFNSLLLDYLLAPSGDYIFSCTYVH